MRSVVVCFLLASILLGAEQPKKQKQEDPPPTVVTQSIEKGTIQTFESFVGTLRFATLSKLAAQSAAAVEKIQVEAGDRVKAGDIIAVLDSRILDATLQAKEAELERLAIQLTQAQKDSERYRALYEQNSVSKQQFEQYQLKALELAAQNKGAEAAAEALRIEMQKRTIRAPYDGIVIERHVSVGDWVSTGSPVATLAEEKSIELLVYLPAQSLGLAQVGKRVNVRAGDRTFPAVIAGVIPRGDSASRTFPVRIGLPDSARSLAEGMEAVAQIPGAEQQEAWLVHRDAVINRFGQNVVFYVAGGKALMAPVEIIGYEGLKTAVKSPQLNASTAVVVKGNERIFPGESVRVTPQAQ